MVKPIHPKPDNSGEALNEALGYPCKVKRSQLSRAIEPPVFEQPRTRPAPAKLPPMRALMPMQKPLPPNEDMAALILKLRSFYKGDSST